MPLPLNDEPMTIEEYYEYTGEERCELIGGHIYYMTAPTRRHQAILRELVSLIDRHIKDKDGDCIVYPAPFSVQLSDTEDTVLEPDISIICDRKKLTDRGCLGAPDWIIEIASPTSISHDYIEKLKLYNKAGVREYWIVNPSDRSVTVYPLERSQVADSYKFTDIVPAGIYEDFSLDFNQIIAMMKRENLN